jgi:hypothetical protein
LRQLSGAFPSGHGRFADPEVFRDLSFRQSEGDEPGRLLRHIRPLPRPPHGIGSGSARWAQTEKSGSGAVSSRCGSRLLIPLPPPRTPESTVFDRRLRRVTGRAERLQIAPVVCPAILLRDDVIDVLSRPDSAVLGALTVVTMLLPVISHPAHRIPSEEGCARVLPRLPVSACMG